MAKACCTWLTSGSSGLIVSTIADNEASATVYTQAGSTIETITTLGTYAAPTATKCRFKEFDATNHAGLYELQIANARWGVSGARYVNVTISGVSKTYAMTGWRMGWSVGPTHVIKAMGNIQSQETGCPCSVSQAAALAALEGDQQCVEDMKADYIKLRDRMLAGFATIPGLTCTVPQGAFYVYPNISAFLGRQGAATASQVASRLLNEAHVVCVPGEAFGTEQHLRFSYATSADVIDKGIERMRTFFAELA